MNMLNENSTLNLSFTHFVTWKKSKNEYHNLYIKKGYNPLFDNPSIRRGMFVHEVAAAYFIQKETLFPEPIKNIYIDKLRNKSDNKFYHLFKHPDTFNMLKELVKLSSEFGGIPIEIEKSYKIELNKDIKLTGKIDLLIKKGNRLSLVDIKTADTILESIGFPNDIQLAYLAMLYYFNEGKILDELLYFSVDKGRVDRFTITQDKILETKATFEQLAFAIREYHRRLYT